MSEQIYEFSYEWSDSGMIAVTDKFGVFTNPFYLIKGEQKKVSVESIINNPPKEFTEPCEACGVSEFQLGVSHAEERVIKLLEKHNCVLDGSHHSENLCTSPHHLGLLIDLIKGEQK